MDAMKIKAVGVLMLLALAYLGVGYALERREGQRIASSRARSCRS